MNYPLTEALLKEMGYTEETPPKCSECKYCIIEADRHLCRSWIYICAFNNIGQLIVYEYGRCKHYTAREK